MHIVMLSDALPPDSSGGAETMAWHLGQRMIAAGQRVTFITATNGPTRRETRQGIVVHALHSHYAERWRAWYGLFNPQTVLPLNRLLRALKPDVIHAHTIHVDLSYHSLVIGHVIRAATVFTARSAAPFAYAPLERFVDPAQPDRLDGWDYHVPFGFNVRQVGLRWNPARNLSIRHTMRYYVDARLAVSGELKKALEANHLPPFEVVYDGVDPAAFDVPDAAIEVLRSRYKLGGRRVILFSARLGRLDGDQQLLDALRRVRAAVPDVALLVLAPTPEYVENLLRQHPDLRDAIVAGGWLSGSELATAYRLADVVAMPSIHFEPVGLMNLEGMAGGAVPVATCFGGAREAVIDGETGFIVNPFNVAALAERLAQLLSDGALRERMAEAGRLRIAEHFTLQQHAEAMLGVYERALARKTPVNGAAALSGG